MCDRHPPELTAEAAAERLADRLDVPELTAGVLDRERDRQASHYLKTTPGPSWTSDHYWDSPPAAPRDGGSFYRPWMFGGLPPWPDDQPGGFVTGLPDL